MSRAVGAAVLVSLAAVAGCATALNYAGETGPRYAGGPSGGSGVALPVVPDHLRFVTFNTHFAERIDRVARLLQTARPLTGADVVLLQEVDARATRRVATALGMFYVYYPASVHPTTGRDFGNAVLSRWPIVDDRKIILPHHGRFRDSQRVATAATIRVGGDSLRVYSVHLSMMAEVSPGARRDQARTVVADALRFHRVVVGGDLNGVEVGEELVASGFLWPTRNNPPTIHVFTWDHIFVKGVEPGSGASTGVVEVDNEASDHRPVWLVVRWLGAGRLPER
jgi:endonuclease/exonuclease/phosphatase family metal-dependent hydrolase